MSLAYEITALGDHVRIVGTGRITTKDCIGVVEHVLHDPRCRPDSTALVDLRDATYDPSEQAEIIDIAKAMESFPTMLKNNIAIVAKQSTIFLAEILSTYLRQVANIGIRVFVDITAAEAFCRGRLAGVLQPAMKE